MTETSMRRKDEFSGMPVAGKPGHWANDTEIKL
jgi:hypothetical protein